MDSQRVDKLKTMIEEFGSSVDEQVARKLELEKCNRIIQKLGTFSSDCKECSQSFVDLENHIKELINKREQLVENDFKHHKQKINHISSHLMKQHKIVTSGYYLSIFMSIGTGVGAVFGLLIFDNIGLGLPLGVGIGVAIGASLDADAKKKGLIL
ncbi:hypothetical protein ACTWP4_02205 [Gracilibacillus sp. D59]|uniref:hypothetical protein n=1 Tax=Gracilibacillus sp. D59 TaxID=3457434 RepID=UPI003FCC2A06